MFSFWSKSSQPNEDVTKPDGPSLEVIADENDNTEPLRVVDYVPAYTVVSEHLSFVIPDIPHDLSVKEKLLRELIQEAPNDEAVVNYLTSKLDPILQKIGDAEISALEENSLRMAQAIIHKFKKWGLLRFGQDIDCKKCFYTGSADIIDGPTNPVGFSIRVAQLINELAAKEGLNCFHILKTLHISSASAERFKGYIEITDVQPSGYEDDICSIPDMPSLETCSDDEDDSYSIDPDMPDLEDR